MSLDETLGLFELLTDRQERIEELVRIARRYHPPDRPKPYPEENRVPGCESEAFVWISGNSEEVRLDVAVENPQGVSAMALATILRGALDGRPAIEFAAIPDDLALRLFGTELSMGKSLGLGNMVAVVKAHAARLA